MLGMVLSLTTPTVPPDTMTLAHSPRPSSALAFVIDMAPTTEDFRDAVLAGLARTPKSLSPKFFYDARGARLFEAITETRDYYITRTELALLERIAPELPEIVGPGAVVVEPGSGSSTKVRLVLDHLDRPAGYIAIDISRDHLIESAGAIADAYPGIAVGAIVADFVSDLSLPAEAEIPGGRRLGFFPGSTVGNFSPPQARTILTNLARIIGRDGGILIGIDLKKDPAVLHAAYNDGEGVTADFNLNLLHRINRELDADIDVRSFEHVAFFNEAESRIEMHLRSRVAQEVEIDGRTFAFAAGETIHTENSYKYDLDGVARLAGDCGLEVHRHWTDPDDLFGVFHLTARTG